MKRILSILAVLIMATSGTLAGTFHCEWNFVDFVTEPQVTNKVEIVPIASYGVNASTIITGDRRTYTNSTSSLIVSNMINGRSYRVTFKGRFRDTVITNSFDTNVTGLVNAADPLYLGVPIRDGSTVAYSQTAADTRFHNTSGDTSTNAIFRGTIKIPAGATVGYVFTVTNADGSGAWQAATGGTSGAFTNNHSVPATFASDLTVSGTANLPTISGANANISAITAQTVTATSFSGSGVNVTGLGGANIVSGTIASNKMDATAYVAFKNDVTAADLAAGVAINGSLTTNVSVTSLNNNRKSSVPVFAFDVNMNSDIEDAPATVMLARLRSQGKIGVAVVAVGGGFGPATNKAPEAARAILDYYGAPDVPIGTFTNFDFGNHQTTSWPNYIVTNQSNLRGGVTALQFETYTRAMRRAFAMAETNSIHWIISEPAAPITNFLASAADDISPYTGIQLAKRAVKVVGWMAGDYPNPTTPEYNVFVDINSFTNFLGQLRANAIPIRWLGFSLGSTPSSSIPTHLQDYPLGWRYVETTSPVYNLMYATTVAGDVGRASWITVNLLLSAFGNNTMTTNLFTTVTTGSNVIVYPSGSNYWQGSLDVGESYVSAVNTNEVQRLIRYYTEHLGDDQSPYSKGFKKVVLPLESLPFGSGLLSSATGITYNRQVYGGSVPALISIAGFIYTDLGSRDFGVAIPLPTTVTQAIASITMYSLTNDSYTFSGYTDPYYATNDFVIGAATSRTITNVMDRFYQVTWTNSWTGEALNQPKEMRGYWGANYTTTSSGLRFIIAAEVLVKNSNEP